ncbi:MAG: hypothetical protein ACO1QS_07265 [Verrucomicrobiota bacterium]
MKTLLLSLILATGGLTAQACGGYGDSDHFFAHEWGTFTSIQGTDGVPIAWQSLIESDLPSFVYNRTRATDAQVLGAGFPSFSKGAISALQRIETPVIYFYSLKPRTVDVRVDLPQGTITEWYPQITKFGPAPGTAVTPYIDPQQRSKSFIEWSKVQIVPASKAQFLDEKRPSHYYAARATDAAPIRVTPPANPAVKGSDENSPMPQDEKFLFYRGIASFPSPLLARATSDNSVVMQNLLDQPLQHIFVIDQRSGEYAFSYHPELAAKKELSADITIISSRTQRVSGREQLIQSMRKSLTTAGLFEKEAAAMVKTWEDSWFDEKGVRILYILPEKWVEATMPLKFNPAPTKTARVYVGRAELFTPKLEQTLTQLVNAFASAPTEQKAVLTQSVRDLRLGRFTQAAFDRVVRKQNEQQFSTAAHQLRVSAQAAPAVQPVMGNKSVTSISHPLVKEITARLVKGADAAEFINISCAETR